MFDAEALPSRNSITYFFSNTESKHEKIQPTKSGESEGLPNECFKHSPMMPFLAADLKDILASPLGRFIKTEAL